MIRGDILDLNSWKDIFSLAGVGPSDPDGTLRVVGNLPFCSATKILKKWVHDLGTRSNLFSKHWNVELLLSFQEEGLYFPLSFGLLLCVFGHLYLSAQSRTR